MQVSLSKLQDMERRVQSARRSVTNMKKQATEVTNTVVGAAEVIGSAFGFGVINGRFTTPEVVGVPVDLGAGVLLHVAGFISDDGSQHLHNLAHGAMGSYFSSLGAGIGQRMLTDRGGA